MPLSLSHVRVGRRESVMAPLPRWRLVRAVVLDILKKCLCPMMVSCLILTKLMVLLKKFLNLIKSSAVSRRTR